MSPRWEKSWHVAGRVDTVSNVCLPTTFQQQWIRGTWVQWDDEPCGDSVSCAWMKNKVEVDECSMCHGVRRQIIGCMCVFVDAWLADLLSVCAFLSPVTLLTICAQFSFLFLTFLSGSLRHVAQRPNSKVPYVHSLFPCRIVQWVTQEVHALVFSALTHDLLWTLTSFKTRDNPRRHLGCREKHKPGLAQRLSLIQRLLSKFAQSMFDFLGDFYRLPTPYCSCVIFQEIRWKRGLMWIKKRLKSRYAVTNPIPEPKYDYIFLTETLQKSCIM